MSVVSPMTTPVPWSMKNDSADARARVDVDAGLAVGPLGHDARQERHAQQVQLVRDAVDGDGPQPRVGEDDLGQVARRPDRRRRPPGRRGQHPAELGQAREEALDHLLGRAAQFAAPPSRAAALEEERLVDLLGELLGDVCRAWRRRGRPRSPRSGAAPRGIRDRRRRRASPGSAAPPRATAAAGPDRCCAPRSRRRRRSPRRARDLPQPVRKWMAFQGSLPLPCRPEARPAPGPGRSTDRPLHRS